MKRKAESSVAMLDNTSNDFYESVKAFYQQYLFSTDVRILWMIGSHNIDEEHTRTDITKHVELKIAYEMLRSYTWDVFSALNLEGGRWKRHRNLANWKRTLGERFRKLVSLEMEGVRCKLDDYAFNDMPADLRFDINSTSKSDREKMIADLTTNITLSRTSSSEMSLTFDTSNLTELKRLLYPKILSKIRYTKMQSSIGRTYYVSYILKENCWNEESSLSQIIWTFLEPYWNQHQITQVILNSWFKEIDSILKSTAQEYKYPPCWLPTKPDIGFMKIRQSSHREDLSRFMYYSNGGQFDLPANIISLDNPAQPTSNDLLKIGAIQFFYNNLVQLLCRYEYVHDSKISKCLRKYQKKLDSLNIVIEQRQNILDTSASTIQTWMLPKLYNRIEFVKKQRVGNWEAP